MQKLRNGLVKNTGETGDLYIYVYFIHTHTHITLKALCVAKMAYNSETHSAFITF